MEKLKDSTPNPVDAKHPEAEPEAHTGLEYTILTNEIRQGAFDLKFALKTVIFRTALKKCLPFW